MEGVGPPYCACPSSEVTSPVAGRADSIAAASPMTVNKERMAAAARFGYMNATDAADYLVAKGIPFRDCHEIIGNMVLYAINKGVALDELTIDEFKSFSDAFDDDIYAAIDIVNCIKAKKSEGSTSFESVKKQLSDLDGE